MIEPKGDVKGHTQNTMKMWWKTRTWKKPNEDLSIQAHGVHFVNGPKLSKCCWNVEEHKEMHMMHV